MKPRPRNSHKNDYGHVLVVAGSWIWCVLMLVAMRDWKRENPGQPVPLAMLLSGVAGLIPLFAINNFKVPFAPVPLVHSIQRSYVVPVVKLVEVVLEAVP